MGLFGWLKKTDEDKFAEAIVRGMKAAAPRYQIEYNKEEFQLMVSTESGENGVANLRNVYVEYCNLDPGDRPQHISNVVRGFLAQEKKLPEEFGDAQHDLLPVLRNRGYYDLTLLHARIENPDASGWPYIEVGEHLGLGLVYDLPEAMRGINQEDLDDWGVSFYEAMEIARQNLEAREAAVAQIGDGFYALATGDSYDATRMIMTERMQKLQVKGDYVAMVPNRESLLITGSDDLTGLKMLLELGRKTYEEGSHPMAACAFRLAGDEWSPWLPADDHELHRQFKEAAISSIGAEYADQKHILEQFHEKNGIDEFVASFSAAEVKGRIVSYCIWGQQIVSLLPRTDKVMFFANEGTDPEDGHIAACGSWGRVLEICGAMMIPVEDLYPGRFRVSEFPTPSQLEAIGMEEL